MGPSLKVRTTVSTIASRKSITWSGTVPRRAANPSRIIVAAMTVSTLSCGGIAARSGCCRSKSSPARRFTSQSARCSIHETKPAAIRAASSATMTIACSSSSASLAIASAIGRKSTSTLKPPSLHQIVLLLRPEPGTRAMDGATPRARGSVPVKWCASASVQYFDARRIRPPKSWGARSSPGATIENRPAGRHRAVLCGHARRPRRRWPAGISARPPKLHSLDNAQRGLRLTDRGVERVRRERLPTIGQRVPDVHGQTVLAPRRMHVDHGRQDVGRRHLSAFRSSAAIRVSSRAKCSACRVARCSSSSVRLPRASVARFTKSRAAVTTSSAIFFEVCHRRGLNTPLEGMQRRRPAQTTTIRVPLWCPWSCSATAKLCCSLTPTACRSFAAKHLCSSTK